MTNCCKNLIKCFFLLGVSVFTPVLLGATSITSQTTKISTQLNKIVKNKSSIKISAWARTTCDSLPFLCRSPRH